MKKIVSVLCAVLFVMAAYAEDSKLRIAVFDPTSTGTSIDEGTVVAVREMISSAFVNVGKYSIVERSLLEKVMEEQSFSNSGAVDENQATEIGKLAGANKIVLSVVTLTGGRNMLSVKMIDVMTAQVDRQRVKIVTSGELLDIVEPLVLEMLGMQNVASNNTSEYSNRELEEAASPKPDENISSPADSENVINEVSGMGVSAVLASSLSYPPASVNVYGVDFSQVRIYGAKKKETDIEFQKAFRGINELLILEKSKYDFERLLGVPTAVFPTIADERNSEIDWFSARTAIQYADKLPVNQMIAEYNIPHDRGIGLVVIARLLNKDEEKALHELVLFDIATRKIIYRHEALCEAGGYGLRNYWANSVYELIDNKELRKQMKQMRSNGILR